MQKSRDAGSAKRRACKRTVFEVGQVPSSARSITIADATWMIFVVTLDRLMAERGITSGFDYLRVFLAVGVLLEHGLDTSYGPAGEALSNVWPLRPFCALILPMFFALSGFLVAGSYFRVRNVGEFVLLRALRIVPALSVEVFLCALVLGSAFTSLPLSRYFSHPTFWNYFGNVVGWIHFVLPGVFEHNPLQSIVNMSLWTVPFELECYVALVLLALAGLLRWRLAFASILFGALIVMFAREYFFKATPPPADGPLPHRLLILCFLSGVLIYLYRDKIKFSPGLAFASVVASLLVVGFPMTAQFYPPLVAYATVAIGMTNPRKTFLVTTGDYSYGIYLYGYPIQQAYATLSSHPQWLWNIAIALPTTFVFAMLSWHCVEKRALKLRKLVLGRTQG